MCVPSNRSLDVDAFIGDAALRDDDRRLDDDDLVEDATGSREPRLC